MNRIGESFWIDIIGGLKNLECEFCGKILDGMTHPNKHISVCRKKHEQKVEQETELTETEIKLTEGEAEKVDSLLEMLAETEDIELSKKEWIEIVTCLSDKDYSELYQTFNEFLNNSLNTTRFEMGERRTLVLGKLTRRVLITMFPKLKPIHLLLIALALSYGSASMFVIFDKLKELKKKREAERHELLAFERTEKEIAKERRERERKAEKERAKSRKEREEKRESVR